MRKAYRASRRITREHGLTDRVVKRFYPTYNSRSPLENMPDEVLLKSLLEEQDILSQYLSVAQHDAQSTKRELDEMRSAYGPLPGSYRPND